MAELSTHEATCTHLGLPSGTEALDSTVTAARLAKEKSESLAREFGRLAERAPPALTNNCAVLRMPSADRDAAEQEAEKSWSEWHATASELAAQHAAIDLPLEQAREELDRTKRARDRADAGLPADAGKAVAVLGPKVGQAQTLSETAAEDVHRQIEQMVAAAHRFNRGIVMPGLAAAATSTRCPPIVHPEQAGECPVGGAGRADLGRSTAPASRR